MVRTVPSRLIAATDKRNVSMHLLLHSINYGPDRIGIAKYNEELAAFAVASGWRVTVVTAQPYYPEWEQKAPRGQRGFRTEEDGGVRIVRVPIYVPGNPSGVRRLLHLGSFAVASALVLLREYRAGRPDVALSVEPTLAALPLHLLLAGLFRVPLWLHVQDIEDAAASAAGLLGGGRVGRFAASVCDSMRRRCSRVSTISRGMQELLAQRLGQEPADIKLVPNWIDPQEYDQATRRCAGALQRHLGVPAGAKTVLYSGNIGRKQGFDIVVEAVRRLGALKDVHFVICAAGAEASRYRERLAGLDNVTWHGLLDREVFAEVLAAADVHLLPQQDDIADLVMPSKLQPIFAVGGLVVGTAREDTELGRVLEGRAVRVEPGDAAAFAEAIAEAVRQGDATTALRRSAARHARTEWDRDAVLSSLLGQLRVLGEGSSPRSVARDPGTA